MIAHRHISQVLPCEMAGVIGNRTAKVFRGWFRALLLHGHTEASERTGRNSVKTLRGSKTWELLLVGERSRHVR